MTTTTDTIIDTFKYWGSVPTRTTYTNEATLRRDYEAQDGETHWFDPETLRFFGSRNRELVSPGIMVECQTNAPADKYVVVAWVYSDDRITPQSLGRFATRKQATQFARFAAADWEAAQTLQGATS